MWIVAVYAHDDLTVYTVYIQHTKVRCSVLLRKHRPWQYTQLITVRWLACR